MLFRRSKAEEEDEEYASPSYFTSGGAAYPPVIHEMIVHQEETADETSEMVVHQAETADETSEMVVHQAETPYAEALDRRFDEPETDAEPVREHLKGELASFREEILDALAETVKAVTVRPQSPQHEGSESEAIVATIVERVSAAVAERLSAGEPAVERTPASTTPSVAEIGLLADRIDRLVGMTGARLGALDAGLNELSNTDRFRDVLTHTLEASHAEHGAQASAFADALERIYRSFAELKVQVTDLGAAESSQQIEALEILRAELALIAQAITDDVTAREGAEARQAEIMRDFADAVHRLPDHVSIGAALDERTQMLAADVADLARRGETQRAETVGQIRAEISKIAGDLRDAVHTSTQEVRDGFGETMRELRAELRTVSAARAEIAESRRQIDATVSWIRAELAEQIRRGHDASLSAIREVHEATEQRERSFTEQLAAFRTELAALAAEASERTRTVATDASERARSAAAEAGARAEAAVAEASERTQAAMADASERAQSAISATGATVEHALEAFRTAELRPALDGLASARGELESSTRWMRAELAESLRGGFGDLSAALGAEASSAAEWRDAMTERLHNVEAQVGRAVGETAAAIDALRLRTEAVRGEVVGELRAELSHMAKTNGHGPSSNGRARTEVAGTLIDVSDTVPTSGRERENRV